MTIRLKVINRKWAIMVHMRIKRQHQRWTLTHDPHARMAMAMDPTLVAFGTFEPTLQVQIVGWKIGHLATHKQPRLKAAHHLGEVLLMGSALDCHPCRSAMNCASRSSPVAVSLGLRSVIHRLQVLGIAANLRQGIA